MKKHKQLKNKKKVCKNIFLTSSNKEGTVATDTDIVARKEKIYYSVGLNK